MSRNKRVPLFCLAWWSLLILFITRVSRKWELMCLCRRGYGARIFYDSCFLFSDHHSTNTSSVTVNHVSTKKWPKKSLSRTFRVFMAFWAYFSTSRGHTLKILFFYIRHQSSHLAPERSGNCNLRGAFEWKASAGQHNVIKEWWKILGNWLERLLKTDGCAAALFLSILYSLLLSVLAF